MVIDGDDDEMMATTMVTDDDDDSSSSQEGEDIFMEINKLNSLVSVGKISEAISLCKNSSNVYSNIAESILSSQSKTRREIEKIAEDEGARQVFRLSQSNELLGS